MTAQSCDQLDPALARLAAEYAGATLIAKVDARDDPGLVRRYGVTHLPGLVFVREGTPVARASGAAPEADLRAWLAHLARGGPRPRCPRGRASPSPGQPRSRRRPPPG